MFARPVARRHTHTHSFEQACRLGGAATASLESPLALLSLQFQFQLAAAATGSSRSSRRTAIGPLAHRHTGGQTKAKQLAPAARAGSLNSQLAESARPCRSGCNPNSTGPNKTRRREAFARLIGRTGELANCCAGELLLSFRLERTKTAAIEAAANWLPSDGGTSRAAFAAAKAALQRALCRHELGVRAKRTNKRFNVDEPASRLGSLAQALSCRRSQQFSLSRLPTNANAGAARAWPCETHSISERASERSWRLSIKLRTNKRKAGARAEASAERRRLNVTQQQRRQTLPLACGIALALSLLCNSLARSLQLQASSHCVCVCVM